MSKVSEGIEREGFDNYRRQRCRNDYSRFESIVEGSGTFAGVRNFESKVIEDVEGISVEGFESSIVEDFEDD